MIPIGSYSIFMLDVSSFAYRSEFGGPNMVRVRARWNEGFGTASFMVNQPLFRRAPPTREPPEPE